MSTILESIARERRLLLNPKPQAPSIHEFYDSTVMNVQNLYNELGNTGEAWSLGEHTIQTTPGQDTYSLASIGDRLGKPLVVTSYSPDGNFVEKAIPFFDIQNINFDWFMPREILGFNWFGSTAADAQRVSLFYDTGGVPRLRFLPVPQGGAQFKLKYTLGNWADKIDLNNSPVLAQFHHLFEIRAAKDNLYRAEWDGLDKDEMRERRREIKLNLDEQEMRALPGFQKHIREMTHSGMVFRKGWND